jgi:hypothetical protein
MSVTTSPIGFDVWDYSTVDGGGYAVIYRRGLCTNVRGGSEDGVFTTRAFLSAGSVEQAEAAYRERWAVTLDVRRCECGCLTGTTEGDRVVFHDGQPVNYHGSLTELHGPAYYCGPCCCRDEACTGAELETPYGRVINHVRYGSYSPRV